MQVHVTVMVQCRILTVKSY